MYVRRSTWIEEVKELLNRLYLKHIGYRTFLKNAFTLQTEKQLEEM